MAKFNPGRAGRRNPRATKYIYKDSDMPFPSASGRRELLSDTIYQFDSVIDLGSDSLKVPEDSVNILTGTTTELQELTCGGFFSFESFQFVLRDMVILGDNVNTFVDIEGETNLGPGPPYRGLTRIYSFNSIKSFALLGSIINSDRLLISESFFFDCGGPLIISNVILTDIRDCRFDYQGRGLPGASFIWVEMGGEVAEAIISGNVFFVVPGPFAKSALMISPTIAPPPGIPIPNTGINITGNIIPLNGGLFFATGDDHEITAITDNLDGTVTLSTVDTGDLANDDEVNILRTEFYNGGYVVSNVVLDTSFDITATYVDNPGRGTWHGGSLDQRDHRINCTGNVGVADSRAIANGTVADNVEDTVINTINVWEPVNLPGFTDVASSMERLALCGDGADAKFIYQGMVHFKGTMTMDVLASTAIAAAHSYEFANAINGVVQTSARCIATEIKNVKQNVSFSLGFSFDPGDAIQPMVRSITGTQDILIENFNYLVTDLR